MVELVRKIKVKSVLNKQKHADEWFLSGYSLNPFSGCSFNCVYCYTRGSKYGENQVPGLAVKINAPEILVKQLKNRARKREYGFIAFGSATDPYLPVEKDLKITRELLMIILRFHFPVNILTRSPLILRDLDILEKIGKKAVLPPELENKMETGVVTSFSFSTTDENLSRIFEPGAPSPPERLKTMKECKKQGFLVGAIFMPLLPFLSDTEEHLEEMIKKVKENGADFILASGLTLFGEEPQDCKTRYYRVLEEHFPELVPKTRALFGNSFAPSRRYQQELHHRVFKLSKKYGIRNSVYKEGNVYGNWFEK
ncbi:radical SAM protein [Methanobacterium formicicum]|uniref:Radical SAM domain-containing protein n=1 Tax=Methanobacterium formicicum (strain DSM 3637 / PP1) TaxID=1204725 RepID=K2QD05_METFP|nr:radical SAM protein [Methanobacterium formicicum]EKF85881.1 Radical SAM domain-containing protein [Methanobacterium formicicum DSM 3637]